MAMFCVHAHGNAWSAIEYVLRASLIFRRWSARHVLQERLECGERAGPCVLRARFHPDPDSIPNSDGRITYSNTTPILASLRYAPGSLIPPCFM